MTTSTTSAITRSDYSIASHGIDTLVVNARGTLFWAVRQQLDELQAQALAERNATHGRRRGGVVVGTPRGLAGQRLLVRPHGGRDPQRPRHGHLPPRPLQL